MNPMTEIMQAAEAEGLWCGKKSLKRGEYLKTGGTIDRKIYSISSGALRAYILDEQEELTIRFGYQGDLLVALDSYISGKASDLYIQALKTSEIQWMKRDDLMGLLNNHPRLLSNWHVILEQLVSQQMERERDLLTATPAHRYARVLQRSPRLFQEVPHKYIASYLRMTPETLSRLQKS